MSIIYDALQKTQRNREGLRLQSTVVKKKSHRQHLKIVALTVFVLAASAGAGAVASFYLKPMAIVGNLKPIITERKAVAPASTSSHPQSLESEHLWVSENKPKLPVNNEVRIDNQQELRAPIVAQNTRTAPKEFSSPSPSLPTPSVPVYLNKLTLNGVLISEQDKVALINNQAFHVGDMVDGMRIVSIDFNRVRLQSGQDLLELRVPV